MKVQVLLESFAADRMQYQPYKPVFKPGVTIKGLMGLDGVSDTTQFYSWILELEVDDKEVRQEGDVIIFTPKGLEEAINKVAEVFDNVHRDYLAKVRDVE